jgi:hypothetical protein
MAKTPVDIKTVMKSPTINPFEPAIFQDALDVGRKRLEAIADLQKEVFSLCEETSRHWLDRLKQEADLTAQLSKELSTCKSVPEAAAKYQDWLGRHVELIAADSESLMSDSQKLMAASARMMSGNGGAGKH